MPDIPTSWMANEPDTPENPAAILNAASKAVLEVAVLVARIAELEAELAKFQTSRFHPDWSLLQAAQENLREAWARIRELESEIETIARIGADDVPGSE